MKIGYLTAFTPDEPKRARRLGFDCLEVHSGSWAGDAVFTAPQQRQQILDDLRRAKEEHGIAITAVAHYGPALNLKGKDLLDSYARAIEIARECGAGVVTAIAARENPEKSVADNIPAFKAVYAEVAKRAEDAGVKVAFENWPGGFGGYPLKGITLAYTPDAWRRMFDAVPSKSLGLEFDPSHLYWQGIDHMAALRQFADRVYHVHAKDTEVFPDKRNAVGIYGDDWWTYRIPGLGAINWSEFVAGLHTLNYTGGLCIEHEDFRFDCLRKDPSPNKFEQGLRIGLATLRPLVG